jgi:hypothetical protein
LVAKDDLTCYHKFSCLVKKWYLQKVILEEIKKCKNFTNNQIENVKENPSQFTNILTDQIKCILLWYGLKNHFINPNWNENNILVYPFDKNMKFRYDYELQDWWLYVS